MKKLLLIFILAVGMQQAMAQAPRKVLIEDMTGAWCGYCPMAMTYIDQTVTAYPSSVIDVREHGPNVSPYDEVMGNTFVETLMDYYQPGGFPSVLVDRADWSSLGVTISPANQLIENVEGHNFIEDAVVDRLNVSSPVSINIVSAFNSGTRSVTATVTANFVGSASGDIRINCYLVEDKVVGGAAYQQSNYGGKNGCENPYSGSEYYNYPCVIGTALTGSYIFYHKNVVRDNMAPTWGTAGVIPSTVTAGHSYSRNYAYTIPGTWNAANMKVVAFVSVYNTSTSLGGEVLNAQEVTLGQSVTAVEEIPSAIDNVSLDAAYPNPFSQITNINVNVPASQHVSVKIYDILGHEVATLTDENLSPGVHTFYWNGNGKDGGSLSNGLYLVKMQTEKVSLSRSIVLERN